MTVKTPIELPNMLLIGASGRNAGKTEFSTRVIARFKESGGIVAAKVTAISRADGVCPRKGGRGCGVCTTLNGIYDIREETDPNKQKDTSRLLAAGAKRVVWMRVLKSRMKEGMAALQDFIGSDVPWLCESNSIRSAVKPGVFLMIEDPSGKYKASAEEVARFADIKVRSDQTDGSFDLDLDRLQLAGSAWVLKEDACAIVLAGGESSRMGRDKATLPLGEMSMTGHIVSQLQGHFESVIISAAEEGVHEALGLPVVVDSKRGCGPLMGIAEALSQTKREKNFIIACDTPEVDMPLVRRMLELANGGCEAVVPRYSDGRIEPLYGIYSKGLEPVIREMLRSGERRVRSLFDRCRTEYFDLPEGCEIINLNTPEEYKAYLAGRAQ